MPDYSSAKHLTGVASVYFRISFSSQETYRSHFKAVGQKAMLFTLHVGFVYTSKQMSSFRLLWHKIIRINLKFMLSDSYCKSAIVF